MAFTQYKTIKKILIIGPNWVGDMVMAQALFRLLKANNREVMIDVLASRGLQPLLDRMPEVNQTIPVTFRHGEFAFRKRYQLGKSLRQAQYDQAIVQPNSWKSALIPFFARIPIRTGWKGEWRYGLLNDLRILNKSQYPLMVERFLALGLPEKSILPAPYPKPMLSINKNNIKELLKKHQVKLENPILVLCPGAQYGSAKQWPAEYFADIANAKIQTGFQVWLLGAGKIDEAAASIIQQQTQSASHNFINQTTLSETIDLMSLAHAVLTNDSGLMHIAAALQLPQVAIYGSSSPAFTPPLNDRAKILSLHLPCSPCFKRVCPLQHLNCLRDLTPEKVLEVLP